MLLAAARLRRRCVFRRPDLSWTRRARTVPCPSEGASVSGGPRSATYRAALPTAVESQSKWARVPQDVEGHPITFLFLYDVWVDLWGREFADAQVKVERARRGVYEAAWQEVLAL